MCYRVFVIKDYASRKPWLHQTESVQEMWKHRETGRKGLYISLSCIRDIEGMTREEARALVEQLNEHATQPEYVYSHHWKVGDLVVWDNRCLLHRATPFDESHIRFMRRTQIKEDGPFSADAA